MTKVFLSYGRENTAQATALAADLADLGHDVWFDDALTGGQAWWNQILERIRGCAVELSRFAGHFGRTA